MRSHTTARFSPTVSMALTGLFAALIAVCSWITIPMAVPFTMQTFAIYCALLVLGGQYGTMALTVYLLLGAVGAPVFAGFRGGIGVLLGATGGYLVGYLLVALLYWLATSLSDKPWVKLLTLVVGHIALCYGFGTAWYVLGYTGSGVVSVATALGTCVIPFIIPDVAKIALAWFATSRLKKRLRF